MDLTHPLIVIDLEATGTWVEKDKIIEVAMIKLLVNGEREVYHQKVNPEMNIPKSVTEINRYIR